MPISTYQISIITRARARTQKCNQCVYPSVRVYARPVYVHMYVYIIQKGRYRPPADPRRRGAPAARGPVLTTLISALRRRRTSSCAIALCARRRFLAVLFCHYRMHRKCACMYILGKFVMSIEIVSFVETSRNHLAVGLWRQRAPGFLFILSRRVLCLCARISLK